jgi:hypothetical protein
MRTAIIILLSITVLITLSACAEETAAPGFSSPNPEASAPQPSEPSIPPETAPPVSDNPFEAAGMPIPFEHQGGDAMLAPFYLPTDNSHSGRNSLNDTPYDLFVGRDAFMAWVNEEGYDFLTTPQTCLTEYPNFYTFILRFGIPVETLREVLKEQQRIGIRYDAHYLTDEEIDIICSLDETRLLAHFASEYAIVIGDRAYPPAWLYLRTPDDYERVGITPEMVAEKLELYAAFNFSAEARTAFEEKLSEFIGETVELGADTSNDAAAVYDVDSIMRGGHLMIAPFFLPIDHSHSGRNSLNDTPYDLFVGRDAFMAWVNEEGYDFLTTPQTCLTEYPNFYTFILRFGIPVETLREVLKEQQRIGIRYDAHYLTDEEIDIICSLDETRLLAHFASEYAIVIGDRAYPPAWLYFNTIEEYERVGITPEMVAEKVGLYHLFRFTDEARAAFEEKLSEFIGETVEIGTALRN